MKCSECKEDFPKEQQAFVKGKLVCQRCYRKLKQGKRNGEGFSIRKEYLEWLQEPPHKHNKK